MTQKVNFGNLHETHVAILLKTSVEVFIFLGIIMLLSAVIMFFVITATFCFAIHLLCLNFVCASILFIFN